MNGVNAGMLTHTTNRSWHEEVTVSTTTFNGPPDQVGPHKKIQTDDTHAQDGEGQDCLHTGHYMCTTTHLQQPQAG